MKPTVAIISHDVASEQYHSVSGIKAYPSSW